MGINSIHPNGKWNGMLSKYTHWHTEEHTPSQWGKSIEIAESWVDFFIFILLSNSNGCGIEIETDLLLSFLFVSFPNSSKSPRTKKIIYILKKKKMAKKGKKEEKRNRKVRRIMPWMCAIETEIYLKQSHIFYMEF